MATTTPNFGWSVPTSTDLVKDGATAIETLGDSIDASLLDLKGGTSGQLLSKNSNTDMDFTWIAAPIPTYTWADYTPTNTGLTIGNGTQVARYVKIGKTVFVEYQFTMGSTSSLTGAVTIGLPSTNKNALMAYAFVWDYGGTVLTGSAFGDPNQGSVSVRANLASSTYVSINNDLGAAFTWVTQDQFWFNLTYEEA